MQSNSIVQYINDSLSIEEVSKHPDLPLALEYLLLKDDNKTMEEIPDLLNNKYGNFPTTRQGTYYRIEVWRNNGTMRLAEQIYLTPKVEEMRAAIGRAITALPDIIDRLVTDAKDKNKSSKQVLDIMNFLMNLAQSEMEKVKEPGDLERSYIKAPRSFDPMDIADN